LAKANPKKPKYRANAAQMQPILQLNAAFIGLKPGEGRAKEGFARTRNLNGGPTSRSKDRLPETSVMANAKLSDRTGRRSDKLCLKRRALAVRSNDLFAVHCSNIDPMCKSQKIDVARFYIDQEIWRNSLLLGSFARQILFLGSGAKRRR
jgi:hypothetical protein